MEDHIFGPVRDMRKMEEEIRMMLSDKTDQERSQTPYMHEMWSPVGHYNTDDVRRRGDKLYKCLIPHDAQPTWTPEDSPSIWVRIMYRDGIRIIPDVIEATQAFSLNELGWWEDAVYMSLINGNVYTPEQYPAGWSKTDWPL